MTTQTILSPTMVNTLKRSLVLSGGGIKASAFHLGVCLALKERGYAFLGGNHYQVTNQLKSI
ncbi:MAG: patatin-like phospholipase family protein, partial [Bdellovibrionaceae bacterium]|nr:patatin-like phospholipase family protein [Pseudobdellovibrionaceae bacterium]MDW8190768.1 hypothetical protein [Pseudobdellovibrionaceae bacterium]